MSPWVEFKSHGKERVSGWMQLDRVKMGWKMARCSCQVSWHTLTVFDSVLLWVCITWTLTNSQWEKRQSRKHVYARGSMHMSSICLCLQNMPTKENIWYAVAYILYICVFVKVCPSLSVFQIQPAVCWCLSCVDDTSCWQWAWGEDASHNITAGRWEDITSKHTHTYTVTNYDTVLKSYQGPYLDWLSSLTSLSILISWTRQPLQAWSCHGPTHKMSHCFISGTVTNAHSLQVPSCSWTSCCAIIDCFIGIHLVLLMSLLLIWN